MIKGLLLSYDRDPLFGFSHDGLVSYLQEVLAGRVLEAYVWGSFVADRLTRFSDIDVLIVTDTAVPFVERSAEFADLRLRVPSIEIVVYTVEEFQRLITEPAQGFWRSVTSSMRRIP